MSDQLATSSLPLCSVIVPVFNGEKFIARCLAALSRQTVSPRQMEVIIVDDGSTDGTAAHVTAWIGAHPGAATLVSQRNRGPASARNHGARMARGRYLLFTDVDCVPCDDWVRTFVERFEQADQPAAIMGSYTSIQRAPAAQFAQLEFEERYALLRARPTIDLVATYSAGYRRDIFLAAGGFDASLIMNEDVDLAYRLSAEGHRLVFEPDAVVEHHHHESWLAYARLKMGRGYWRTLVYRRFPQKAVRDSYTPQMLKLQPPFAFLVLGAPCLALIFRSAHWLWLALPFVFTTAPTLRAAMRTRRPAPHWVVWGEWLRAIALTAGVVSGLLAAIPQQPVAASASKVVPQAK